MNELDDIDRAYGMMEKGAFSGWSITSVFWAELEGYHNALKIFESSIKLHGLDETWSQFIGFCKRYGFLLASTPLSPARLVAEMNLWRINQGVRLDQLKLTLDAPQERAYARLLAAFSGLERQGANPLWDAAKQSLYETWESGVEIAVLCTESRLCSVIQNFLTDEIEQIGTCHVLKPTELKSCYMYDQFLAFGPTKRRFFDGSEFVYTTPRSSCLNLYTPHIFKTSIPKPYQFSGSPHRVKSEGSATELASFAAPQTIETAGNLPTESINEAIIDEEWLASLPIMTLPSRPLSDAEKDADWSDEVVIARQVLLTADHGVLLSADGGIYRVGCVRDSETGSPMCSGVEFVEVEDLGPGDVILFQERGGGSMVAEVANELMGERALEFRGIQSEWKDPLRMMVRREGVENIARKLRAAGASIKTSITVRNWCQPENIGPGGWSNFELLLSILDLHARKAEIFEATRAIRSAHQSAGFKLAGRLMEMMKGRSLVQLEQTGFQDFGGSPGMPNRKVAYEIVAVLPQTIEVEPSQLQHPFALK